MGFGSIFRIPHTLSEKYQQYQQDHADQGTQAVATQPSTSGSGAKTETATQATSAAPPTTGSGSGFKTELASFASNFF